MGDPFSNPYVVAILIYSFVCALLCHTLAHYKNYHGPTWFVVGLLFGILGLITAAGLPVHDDTVDEDDDPAEKHAKPESGD